MKHRRTITALMLLLCAGARAAEKYDWKPITRKDFLEVTKGRCPIIWSMNPNDPGYDALVREDAASGILAVIHPGYLEKDPRAQDMEYGPYDTKRWKGYYRGTDWETLGWRFVEPPVQIPRTNFPIRYRRAFDDSHIKKIVKDGLFLFSYENGIQDASIDVARKCREALGNKFIVLHTLEKGNGVLPYLRDRVKKENLDPSNLTKQECFEMAKEWVLKEGGRFPERFGFGDSALNIIQTVDILNMDRWDAELANGPRQIELAFYRGIKRQYDVPFVAYIACYNTTKEGLWSKYVPHDTPYQRFFRFAYSAGGKPPHLLNRTFWVTWFSDANAIVGESAYTWCIVRGKDENHFELSDLGRDLKKLYGLADSEKFDRGEPYVPACLLLDYYNGWVPTHSFDAHSWDPPAFDRRRIWGVLDYKKADFMIDNFFGAIFPGHHMAAGWGSPYGDLVDSPYGDSFDAMLSNASADALKKYPVLFVLGNPEMTDELFDKLSSYVNSGGELVLNVMQMTDKWKDLLRLKMTPQNNRWYKGPGHLRVGDWSQWGDREKIAEKRYFYYIIESLPDKAEVLATNPETGHTLITRIPVGKGSVDFVAIQYMQETSDIYRPYGLTECCKTLIGETLEPYQHVSVDGERSPDFIDAYPGVSGNGNPLEYIVRKRGDTLLALLVNNRPEAWEGAITLVPFKKSKGYTLTEWYEEGKAKPCTFRETDRGVTIDETIPAHDMKLYVLAP